MQRFWGQLSNLDSMVQAVGSFAKQAVQSFEQDSDELKKEVDPTLLPWHLPPEYQDKESFIKKQVLLLSEEKWNFLESPNAGNLLDWEWDFDAEQARACLLVDPKLDRLRFLLVPYKMKEEDFWRNYFARVHIIKRSILDPNIRFSHNERKNSPTVSPKLSQYTKKTTEENSLKVENSEEFAASQNTKEPMQTLWRMEESTPTSQSNTAEKPLSSADVVQQKNEILEETVSPSPKHTNLETPDHSVKDTTPSESASKGSESTLDILQTEDEQLEPTPVPPLKTEREASTPSSEKESEKEAPSFDAEKMSLAEELGLDDLGIDLDDIDLSSVDLTGDPDIDELMDL